MFSFNKDTILFMTLAICFLGVIYLYREVQKIKKVPMPVRHPVVPNHAPVNDTVRYAPPPPPPQPVQSMVQSQTASPGGEEKPDGILTVEP
jgi:hypothetical protein